MTRFLITFGFVSAFNVLLTSWAATQFLAWWYGRSPKLGPWVWDSEATGKVYWPWMVWEWHSLWGADLKPVRLAAMAALAAFCLMTGGAVYARLRDKMKAAAKDVTKKPEWGGETELRKLGLIRGSGLGQLGGAVLGQTENGKLIVFRGDHLIAVFGPPGEGKTSTIAIPTILAEDQKSMVVIDNKGRELYKATGRHRQSLGPCGYFDATDPDSIRWNPLDSIPWGTRNDEAVAENVVKTLFRGAERKGVGQYYTEIAEGLLQGIFIHLAYDRNKVNLTLSGVHGMLADFEAKTLDRMKNSSKKLVVDAAKMFADCEHKGGVIRSIDRILRVYSEYNVAATTSETTMNFGDLMVGPESVSLYITSPQEDATRLAPLQALLQERIVAPLLYDDYVLRDGRRKVRPVRWIGEEFADNASIGNISANQYVFNKLLVMRSAGFHIMIIAQSQRLLNAVYGRDNGIIAMAGPVCGFATNDDEECDFWARSCGTTTEIVERVTHKKGMFFRDHEKSISVAAHKTPLMSRPAVRGMPVGRHLMIMRHEDAAFMPHDVLAWEHPLFKDRYTNVKAGEEPPGQSQWVLERLHGKSSSREPASRNPIARLASLTGWTAAEIVEHVFGGVGDVSAVTRCVHGTRFPAKAEKERAQAILDGIADLVDGGAEKSAIATEAVGLCKVRAAA